MGMRPKKDGGHLEHKGQVEVISSLERDGRPVFRDLRWGIYVAFEAPNEYVRRCFAEYGLKTDASGWYSAMYKPYHLIGRSEEHTSELQSLMRISYAVFCLKKKNITYHN